mgnify:FL=1
MTELKEQIFSEINEKIYSAELENGLKIFLIPKQRFSRKLWNDDCKFWLS